MASELDGLNQTRKEIEEGMKQEAMAFCERLQFSDDAMPYGLVLFSARLASRCDWHFGISNQRKVSSPSDRFCRWR